MQSNVSAFSFLIYSYVFLNQQSLNFYLIKGALKRKITCKFFLEKEENEINLKKKERKKKKDTLG